MIDKEGANLQTWGIVQNLSGEDWTNVSLSLVAEAPLAFDASLATPIIPPRPTVSDGGDVIAVVPRSETSLAQAGAAAAAARVGARCRDGRHGEMESKRAAPWRESGRGQRKASKKEKSPTPTS